MTVIVKVTRPEQRGPLLLSRSTRGLTDVAAVSVDVGVEASSCGAMVRKIERKTAELAEHTQTLQRSGNFF